MYSIVLLATLFALIFFMKKVYLTKKTKQFKPEPAPLNNFPNNIYNLADYKEKLIDAGVIFDTKPDTKVEVSSGYDIIWSEEDQDYVKIPKNKIGKLFITLEKEDD